MKEMGVAIGVAVALSTATVFDLVRGISKQNSPGNLSVSTSPLSRSSGRVASAHVERLRHALSERDWAVIRDVARLRLVTGAQLERLHFAELTSASGLVVRRRVLGRLIQARVLATLPRRIGGVRAGSAGQVYHLDTAGQRLLSLEVRARRIDPPGERYVRHALAVSELYVALTERTRTGVMRLDRYEAEPFCWWPDGRGGHLKPDAYVLVSNDKHHDHWWIEVDLATEHLPALKRKISAYVDFFRLGQLGPEKIMPWVLVSVPDIERCSQLVRLIRQLPHRADELFTVAVHNDAADVVVRRLGQP